MSNCLYCNAQLVNPNQRFCNPDHHKLYNENGPIIQVDPVVDFLSRVTFSTDVFTEIALAHNDPERWEKYFKTPDVLMYNAARGIIGQHDENKNDPISNIDHVAFYNLLGWLMVKCITDPVWFSYLGWMNRFIAAHGHASSYFPLQYHERFNPNFFFTLSNQNTQPHVENKKFQDPAFAFQWVDPRSENNDPINK